MRIFRIPPFQAVSGLPDSSGGDRDGGHDTDSQMNSGSDAETKESSSDKYLHHVSKSSHSISKSGGGSSNKFVRFSLPSPAAVISALRTTGGR